MSLASLTYILRLLGILLVLPSIFPAQILRLFPGLEAFPNMLNVLFFIGIAVFVTGAVLHYVARKSRKSSPL